MAKTPAQVSEQQIENAILLLRGDKVLLDADLARLYGVTTRALNQAVKRNRSRFPDDFMFRLSAAETRLLNRSQNVTGSQKHRDPRYPPYAFTEQGVAMLSSVLRSDRAVQVTSKSCGPSFASEKSWLPMPKSPAGWMKSNVVLARTMNNSSKSFERSGNLWSRPHVRRDHESASIRPTIKNLPPREHDPGNTSEPPPRGRVSPIKDSRWRRHSSR
jgi:ORF6N domain